MTITADAPRGGVVEEIDGVTYTFLLRNREIERFEDKHRGIFEVWDGFFDRGTKPNSKEIKDLIALALVGGGMKDHLLSVVGFSAQAPSIAETSINQDHNLAAPELAVGAPEIPALVYDIGIPRQIDFNEPSNNVVAAENSVNQVLVA